MSIVHCVSNQGSSQLVQADYVAAMDKVRGEVGMVPTDSFLPITTDPVTAANVVLATHAARMELVEDIRANAPKFPIESFDRVHTLALALLWADAYYALSARGVGRLPQLDEQAGKFESILRATAQALAAANAIDGSSLGELPNAHGYRNRIFVLSALDALFRSRWAELEGKVPFGPELLDSTLATVREMGELLAVRDRTSPTLAQAATSRQAVYTLLMQAWPAVQRVVNFVRGSNEDGDKYAPSLFVRAASEHKDKADASTQPGAPMQAFDKDGKPVLVTPTANAATASVSAIPSNLPGGSPFAQ